jgi:signal transduction histidine kinase
MAAIQVLITDDANRRALAAVVEKHHSVIKESEVQPADLYLVDDASLPEYRMALDTHKHEQAPVFCPVVLIRRDRTPIRIELPDPGSSDPPLLVNEVVTAPVEEATLVRRLANLLVRRRQTADLQETNARLEQFASTLRHELRNPLNVLDGYLDVAREEGTVEAFEQCQIAIDQMERMLEETLVVLKGGEPEIEREPVELAVLCQRCWEMAPEEEARLEVTTTQRIAADKDRLTQLLENLFRNAVEHGGSDVTVTVGELDDGFYVEDDGPGIPEEERESVFEEGYSTRGAGMGLGLAVVEAVTEVHGWEVELTEGSCGGARFAITGIDLHDDA